MNLAKKAAAEAACELVKTGMKVGLGTGSTSEFAIKRLGEMVADGLKIQGVPSSIRTEKLAKSVGIPIIPYEEFVKKKIKLDIDIDGADTIDPDLRLIKGGGGAHTREKVVATASKLFLCVADESKLVKNLIGSFPLPVEVRPEDLDEAVRGLRHFGTPKMRVIDQKVFITDNSNYVVELSLSVGEPDRLEVDINRIPGVVDNGFFTRRRPEMVFVGQPDGTVRILTKEE